jgi:hypothetical protein
LLLAPGKCFPAIPVVSVDLPEFVPQSVLLVEVGRLGDCHGDATITELIEFGEDIIRRSHFA